MSVFLICLTRTHLIASRTVKNLIGLQHGNKLLSLQTTSALLQYSTGSKPDTTVSKPDATVSKPDATDSKLDETDSKTGKIDAPKKGLMEFFEAPKLWGEQEIKSGRSWTTDELRLKSNSDLHKLWFVLYKEKNMLLTMEQAAKDEVEYFPSPERRDKVEISMENIEAVVRERNKAYHDLETGSTGERPHDYKEDEFGRFDIVPLEEHLIPVNENEKFLEENLFPTMETVNPTLEEFHLGLKEKERLKHRYDLRQQKNYIFKLFRKFPDTDLEALQEKYPEINVYNLKKMMT